MDSMSHSQGLCNNLYSEPNQITNSKHSEYEDWGLAHGNYFLNLIYLFKYYLYNY